VQFPRKDFSAANSQQRIKRKMNFFIASKSHVDEAFAGKWASKYFGLKSVILLLLILIAALLTSILKTGKNLLILS